MDGKKKNIKPTKSIYSNKYFRGECVMAKYRKKPVVIEAVQWNGWGDDNSDVVEIPCDNRCPFYNADTSECADDVVCSPKHPLLYDKSVKHFGYVYTLEGGHVVTQGDYIITGVRGEKYPCKPDIFEITYERADGEEDIYSAFAKAKEVLRKLEYLPKSVYDDLGCEYEIMTCPICCGVEPSMYDGFVQDGGYMGQMMLRYNHRGHTQDCELAKLIKEEKENV